MALCAGGGVRGDQDQEPSGERLSVESHDLTWDLLRSSPDWDAYVPMKYGGFFSDPEDPREKKRAQKCDGPEADP